MANTLHLRIVTPEAVSFAADVEMVTLPGSEGELGIYPQHIPLLTQIVPGDITVIAEGKEVHLAVGAGFAEITPDRVAILTDMAMTADNIDEAKAEEARRAAEARLASQLEEEDAATVRATLAKSLAQLHVKRQHRK